MIPKNDPIRNFYHEFTIAVSKAHEFSVQVDELINENDIMRQQLDFIFDELSDISNNMREFFMNNPTFLDKHKLQRNKLFEIRDRINKLRYNEEIKY